MTNWGDITPGTVAQFISFDRENDQWTYDPGLNLIYDLQAEGVAGLWNILNRHKIAIMADEVGMGKTMQALGVCSLLWRIKPDARVLVFAPNHSVASNWVNEYKTYIKSHYKVNDNLVRTEVGKEAVHLPVLCGNLAEMGKLVERKWCHLIIGKISSLSFTHASDKESNWNAKVTASQAEGETLRNRMLENFGGPIDLLIIDEAQYFRNVNGDSLRVNTARGLFGNGDEALAERVLLMTATPNHSSNQDISNIVSYFNDRISKKLPGDILKEIGLRRFRRLAGKTKYEYREEQGIPCDFGDNQLGELFYGLYQRELAGIAKKEKKSFTYGYLEGFESTSFEQLPEQPKSEILKKTGDEHEDESKTESKSQQPTDYDHSEDSRILNELANHFKKHNKGDFPVHPKYQSVTSRVVPGENVFWIADNPDNGLRKSLIFVRRIPSVRELAARINRNFDLIFMNRICSALEQPFTGEIPSREQYGQLVSPRNLGQYEGEDDDSEEEKDLSADFSQEFEIYQLNSEVFDLFRTKDDGKSLRNTHASRFRNRFSTDNDPFSLFFQPALDYGEAHYNEFFRLEGDKQRTGFFSSALKSRLKDKNEVIFNTLQRDSRLLDTKQDVGNLSTLWEIYFPLLTECSKSTLSSYGIYQKEAFSRFLQQGVLRASPSLIELYSWFIQAEKSGSEGIELYRNFTGIVRENIASSLLFETIQRTIRQFVVFAEKICGIFGKEEIVRREWKMFNRQNPCYSCSGGTSNRDWLIQAFNSPFYPNVMVATSVFQEGVNLQYNCDSVYHYGIAWTPGDNEQRVGRIDRMFSKTERKIQKTRSETATLDILYPYLDNTFDRDQVAAFIKQKYRSEQTLDMCQLPEGDNRISSDAAAKISGWQHYLRKPVAGFNAGKDPYKPCFSNVSDTYTAASFSETAVMEQFYHHLKREISGVVSELFPGSREIGFNGDFSFPLYEVRLLNGRTQPLRIKIHFNGEFSGLVQGTVYYVSFTTPLSSQDDVSGGIRQEYLRIQERFPLVRVCLDEETRTHYRIYMRTDLPLFVGKAPENSNIQASELKAAITQLLYCADIVEEKAMDGRDLIIKSIADAETGFEDTRTAVNEMDCTELGNYRCERFEKPLNGLVLDCWEMNHEFAFIKALYVDDRETRLMLPYCSEDLDDNERELLNRWFEHVVDVAINVRARKNGACSQGTTDLGIETNNIMRAFRSSIYNHKYGFSRYWFIKNVAHALGWKRTTQSIRAGLEAYIPTACKRWVITVDKDICYKATHSINDYDDDFLRKHMKTVMVRAGKLWDRDEVTDNLAAFLGFSAVSPAMKERMKSIFNSAIRRGILFKDGWQIGRVD